MMTTAMCPLCVLLLWALLCPGRGNVPGVREEIFTRPGSDLLLPIRIHLTLNHTDKEKCDEFEWKYKDPTNQTDTRIFKQKLCKISNEDLLPPNMRISENGSLIISNVTLRNDGIYSVIIHNSAGDHQQTDYYSVHVEVPVSVLDLKTTCLQNGSAKVFCEVKEGTKPNISLIVIGGSQKNDSASANNITAIAEPPGPWNITCTVKNRLNQSEISKPGVTCPAPLANITVNSTCHPNGSAEAECSVKGSDPRYSWYLNGDLKSSESRVTLQPPVSGTLRCNVSNQISNLTASINISCAVPVSDPVLDMRCLQNGSAEISCEVKEGTDPSIYLTVRRKLEVYDVTGSEQTVRVTVPFVSPPDSWNINCSAKNNISERFTNETRDTCPDPLSAPRVNASCNDNGSASVYCVLEENEDLSYNWTVNGKFLHGNHSRNITINNEEFLFGPVNVSCSVNNSVSKKESNNTNIKCIAPPSTPNVIFFCQYNGSVSASCVVEKDQEVIYNWTVNGKKIYGNHSCNITFPNEAFKTVPMNVSCSVQNSMSTKESNSTQISCPDTSSCFICLKNSLIWSSAALLLTMSLTFIHHCYLLRGMKKKS